MGAGKELPAESRHPGRETVVEVRDLRMNYGRRPVLAGVGFSTTTSGFVTLAVVLAPGLILIPNSAPSAPEGGSPSSAPSSSACAPR
ncbi:hypothetical protein [Nonomuraea longicatena]|uniref:Uncharacterized protein n=1 Tax=Nonomuraea longicatena TaxID=83682 RepID=A0ABN1P7I2_9ACTN